MNLTDDHFPAEQQQRLAELMRRWRESRDAEGALPPDEQAELESLVDAELRATIRKAEHLANGRRR